MEPLLDKWRRKDSPLKSRFFLIGDWYSWIAPLVAIIIASVVYSEEDGYGRHHPLGDTAVDIAFCVCISALVFSLASISGINPNDSKGNWRAFLGMVVSFFGTLYAAAGIYSRIARQ